MHRLRLILKLQVMYTANPKRISKQHLGVLDKLRQELSRLLLFMAKHRLILNKLVEYMHKHRLG